MISTLLDDIVPIIALLFVAFMHILHYLPLIMLYFVPTFSTFVLAVNYT
jgi:hypothetical protein